jgi:hypothetical protein
VELKFETLLEIQFSETQQTNQRQQDHAKGYNQNGEQRTQSMPNAPGILEERRA